MIRSPRQELTRRLTVLVRDRAIRLPATASKAPWARLSTCVLTLLLCLAAALRVSFAGSSLRAMSTGAGSVASTERPGGKSARPGDIQALLLDATPIQAGTAPRTCLAFSPVRGDRHRTIFVDPGHGGVDSGTYGSTSAGATVYEKQLTLATGLDLLADLRADGFRVVMSRIDDRLVTVATPDDVGAGQLTLTGEHDDTAARIACADAARADMLISLHFNAFSDPTVGGSETIYDSARPFSAANERLAGLAQRDVLAQFDASGWPVPDRGMADDSSVGTPTYTAEAASYGHLLELGPAAPGWLSRPSTMPGILIEPLFLSRPSEADVAASGSGQQAIARGLAQAVDSFFAPAGLQRSQA